MELKKISTDEILEPETTLRTVATREGIEELAISIKNEGLLQPILVRKIEKEEMRLTEKKEGSLELKPIPEGKKYEIIAGWRRFKAAQRAKLATVPCLVVDASEEKKDMMMIHENLHREDVSDTDLGKFFQHLHQKYNLSTEKIAKMIGKSQNYVQQRIWLMSKDPKIIAALDGKRISFGVARELAGIENERVRHTYLDHAVRNGASTEAVRLWKRNYYADEQTKEKYKQEPSKEAINKLPEEWQEECFNCGRTMNGRFMTRPNFCPDCWNALRDALRGKKNESPEKQV